MSSLVNKPIVNRGQTFSDTQKSQARQNIGAASDFDLQNETSAREAADTQLQSNIESETTRAQNAETALDARIDALDDIYETKVDAKSKAETYGILMRENGTNTLQFYRPSLA